MDSPNPQEKDTNEETLSNLRGTKRSVVEQPIYESLKRKTLPRNAQAIALILKSFGIIDVQPNVIYQLQEFANRYTIDTLQDAHVLSVHGDKPQVDLEDIKEAIYGRIHHSFAPPPNQEFLKQLANKVNSKPLPIIHEKFGPRLPKDKYCLTATNFQILPEGTVDKKDKEDIKNKVNIDMNIISNVSQIPLSQKSVEIEAEPEQEIKSEIQEEQEQVQEQEQEQEEQPEENNEDIAGGQEQDEDDFEEV